MKTKITAVTILMAGFLGLWLLKDAEPVIRLLAASLGLIWVIKVAALLWQKADGVSLRSPEGTLAFLFLWPGVSVAGFTERRPSPPPNTGSRFLESWLLFSIGLALLFLVSILGRGESLALNYVALLSILLIVHLGLVGIFADALRLLGFSPNSLFDRPYLASSLRDFWSIRWNRAFVDMNRIFLLQPLRGKVPASILTFSIFLVSGLLHEIGISFADGVSWGRPLSYFAIQGLGMEFQRRKKFPLILVWLWILLPLPLLFTPEFTNLFLGGLGRFLAQRAETLAADSLLPWGFIAGGALHLLVLCASIQVPDKLGWKEEFAKLRPLNRKVFWTYGAYIFSIIVFLSVVSFVLAREMPSIPVFLWALFTALFWWARVLTDFFYMKHEDWPQGPLFEIGHICLTTVFFSLAGIYSALAFYIFQKVW